MRQSKALDAAADRLRELHHSDKKSIRLLDTRTVGESLAHLRYEVVRDA
jgi:hypothetical protein